jgi:hypothetical protein
VHVLGRTLALARRNEVPPCTSSTSTLTVRSPSAREPNDSHGAKGSGGGGRSRAWPGRDSPSVSRQIRHCRWSPAPAPASRSISDGGGISGDDASFSSIIAAGCSAATRKDQFPSRRRTHPTRRRPLRQRGGWRRRARVWPGALVQVVDSRRSEEYTRVWSVRRDWGRSRG